MCIPTSMYNATVLDSAYLSSTAYANYDPVDANTTFVLPASNNTSNNATYPGIVISLAMGSNLMRVDVVPAATYSNATANATTVLGVKTLGNIEGYPSCCNSRAQWAVEWTGQLEDGSFAPAGTYTLLVRALRIFGDANTPDDYEEAQTVPFSISYA